MGRNKYREDLWDIFSPSEMEWIQKALADAEISASRNISQEADQQRALGKLSLTFPR